MGPKKILPSMPAGDHRRPLRRQGEAALPCCKEARMRSGSPWTPFKPSWDHAANWLDACFVQIGRETAGSTAAVAAMALWSTYRARRVEQQDVSTSDIARRCAIVLNSGVARRRRQPSRFPSRSSSGRWTCAGFQSRKSKTSISPPQTRNNATSYFPAQK